MTRGCNEPSEENVTPCELQGPQIASPGTPLGGLEVAIGWLKQYSGPSEENVTPCELQGPQIASTGTPLGCLEVAIDRLKLYSEPSEPHLNSNGPRLHPLEPP